MSLSDDLKNFVDTTIRVQEWNVTDGREVPTPATLTMSNVGKKIEATVLYADLAESTSLVAQYRATFAAEVYKAYLYCSSRLIRAHDGEVAAFDGDRVMGVFIGGSKNTNAAKCALRINWAVKEIITPALTAQYPGSTYALRQKVGIDTSELLVVKTGVRGDNDLVWIGNAANRAAKLATRDASTPTYITEAVYSMLNDEAKYAKSGGPNMWTRIGTVEGQTVYGSLYSWGL